MSDMIAKEAGALPSGLISRKNAAAFLGRSPQTLANWHALKRGPVVKMVLGRVFYDFEEIKSFLSQEHAPSGSEMGGLCAN